MSHFQIPRKEVYLIALTLTVLFMWSAVGLSETVSPTSLERNFPFALAREESVCQESGIPYLNDPSCIGRRELVPGFASIVESIPSSRR